MRLLRYTIVSFLLIICLPLWAEEYDADVTTSSGTYSVPVEVEDGEVTTVNWPNGGNMNVDGATISGTSASGTNSRGDSIDIEIPDYHDSDNGEDE